MSVTSARIETTVNFLELEITGTCQLQCAHCYAESGPNGDHGTMSAGDWEKVIDQATALGIETVQFIGGEPTLAPHFRHLAGYALDHGLKVDVYSNLVYVTDDLWELFCQPGVSLGTSWYSADPDTHATITGTKGSHSRTRANIIEAVRRGIPIRGGIVEVVESQGIQEARQELLALGVTKIQIDHARGVGRAAHRVPNVGDLCGNCGRGRAAISPHGFVSPCVIGRFLVAGNVKRTTLGEILNGERWREIVASVPPRDRCTPMGCTPSDGNDCNPSV